MNLVNLYQVSLSQSEYSNDRFQDVFWKILFIIQVNVPLAMCQSQTISRKDIYYILLLHRDTFQEYFEKDGLLLKLIYRKEGVLHKLYIYRDTFLEYFWQG